MFYAEKYSQEIFEKTAFLDRYDADWLERLYNILHGYRDIVKCKYCGEKAIWSGRMTYGYKEICGNKQCRSKQLTEAALGKTTISENRNKKFTDSIKDIVEVDDNVILKLIKYERQLTLINNEHILSYLHNRFSDSDSIFETYQRIKFGIEEKPKCPTCGKPVKWVGKKNKMFTTYC